MTRERLLVEVARFCKVPYSQHGTKGSGERFKHDWAHLVETISRLVYRKLPSDVGLIAARLRIEYPNTDTGWNARVNADGVHENILRMILEGLQKTLGPAAVSDKQA